MSAAALVMATAPDAARVKTPLKPLLGAEGCARLQVELIRQAAEWALEVAPGAAWLAHTPARARETMEGLVANGFVPEGCELFPQKGRNLGQRLDAATRHVLEQRPGPLLVIGTDAPTMTLAHAAGARGRLMAGDDVCFGPATGGGYYLVALDRPQPSLFALPAKEWREPRVLELSLRAAREAGLTAGLLGEERELETPEDAEELMADPRLPPAIRALLEPA
jgi:glycosyltransferase A (GT-A) superfamily protein (DUF2064 family)